MTTVSGGLNMRMEGKSGSPILTVIPRNTVIDVLSVGNSRCHVSYGGRTGYVMTVFLTLEESTVTPTMAPTAAPTVEPTVAPTNEPAVSPSVSPTASPEKTPEPTAIPTAAPTAAGPQYALVTTASGSLNLRAQPSAIGALVTQIPRFGMVEVLEYGSEWCRLRYNALEGYAMTRYLTLASGTATVVPTPSATPDPSAGTARVNTVSGGLNLRQSPKASAKVLTVIPRHALVEVLLKRVRQSGLMCGTERGTGMWFPVICNMKWQVPRRLLRRRQRLPPARRTRLRRRPRPSPPRRLRPSPQRPLPALLPYWTIRWKICRTVFWR